MRIKEIVNEASDISQAPKSVQNAAIARNGNVIQYIPNPTPDQILAALTANGEAIRFIENPTPQQQVAAIASNGSAIKYLVDPHPDLQVMAVNDSASNITYINNPVCKAQLIAVKQYPSIIDAIAKPCDEAIIIAYNNGSRAALDLIKNKDNDFFEKYKKDLLRSILLYIKQMDYYSSLYLYQIIKDRNLDWPELDTIQRGIDSIRNKV